MSFSEMFGDLWDMCWHHDWCLRNYLDPLTINFCLLKLNRSRKHRIIVMSYSAIRVIHESRLELIYALEKMSFSYFLRQHRLSRRHLFWAIFLQEIIKRIFSDMVDGLSPTPK